MVSAQTRRQQVEYAEERGLPSRRGCALLSVARSTSGYEMRPAAKDALVAARPTLSVQYPRFGYRRIYMFLERQGHVMCPDRAHRLWRQHGLQVPRHWPRRRIATGRPRPLLPECVNHVWAYDFVFDACANGQQLKCLTMVDECSRGSLAIAVVRSIRSGRVIEALARLISVYGAPQFLRSDHGSEFVATALPRWLATVNIETALIELGRPWQNGLGESFNGNFRDECLSLERFQNRSDAKIVIESWRRHYNEVRPHLSLGNLTPAELKRRCSTSRPAKAICEV
jgi:putative transposase